LSGCGCFLSHKVGIEKGESKSRDEKPMSGHESSNWCPESEHEKPKDQGSRGELAEVGVSGLGRP
jgi:uncharacterized protein YceK